MEAFMARKHLYITDRAGEMDDDNNAKTVTLLMRRSPWAHQASDLSRAVQHIYEHWLAGLRDDNSTVTEVLRLARVFGAEAESEHGKCNGSSDNRASEGLAENAAMLVAMVDRARRSSGERESSFWARVAAAQAIIDEQGKHRGRSF